MKNFRLEVPETKGVTICENCPWKLNQDVCKYCDENNLCRQYDFEKLHLWDDLDENKFYEEDM